MGGGSFKDVIFIWKCKFKLGKKVEFLEICLKLKWKEMKRILFYVLK